MSFDVVCEQPVIDRAVHNSPPPLDDVGGCDPLDFDEKDPDRIEGLLTERGRTHGDFSENSHITQELKMVLRRGALDEIWRWDLSDIQREAIEMIFHKIGRIIAGNPDFADHWDDIAGYAKLVADRVRDG